MSLNLRILVLLQRTYKPSSTVGMKSGRFDLLILTDKQGAPVRVYISLAALLSAGGEWYNRKIVRHSEPLRYTWEIVY